LTVTPAPFLLLVAPTSQAVTRGQSTTYTVSSLQSPGFGGSISLGASGVPTGASPSFNPTSISGGTTSTLTVTTSSSTPSGVFPLTITGTSGALPQATATAGLIVAAPPVQTGPGCTV